MGLLPQIAEGVDVSIPHGRAHHLRVRRGRGRRRAGAGLPRRPAAAARVAGRADGRLRRRQRGQRARHVVRVAQPGQRRHGLPARRLLRRRVVGGGLARAPGPQGTRRRHGDAGPVGRQRDRRARRHLAGPAPRLARRPSGRSPDSPCSRPPSCSLRALVPRRRRRHRAARAAGVPRAAGVADPARGRGRLRRHVRRLLLHRADGHRGRRPARGAVPVFLLAFGIGMVAGTWLAGELADWSVFRSLLGSAIGMAVVLLAFTVSLPRAGGCCRSASW